LTTPVLTLTSPLHLPPRNVTLARVIVTPPITIVIRITAPIHPTAPQLAHQATAYRAAKAVSVVLARNPGVGRAVAVAQLADFGVRRDARGAAFGSSVAVVVLLAGAAGVGASDEGEWEGGCGGQAGEGDEGKELHGGWL
jgi:hypothetical protein